MVGNTSSFSTGASVSGRASLSPTQPTAGPEVANGLRKLVPDTCRTPEIARTGEIAARRRPISRSTSSGTR